MLFWRAVDISCPSPTGMCPCWKLRCISFALLVYWISLKQNWLWFHNDFDWKLTFFRSFQRVNCFQFGLDHEFLRRWSFNLFLIFCAILLEKHWRDWKVENVQLVRELNIMVPCSTWFLPVCRRGLQFLRFQDQSAYFYQLT